MIPPIDPVQTAVKLPVVQLEGRLPVVEAKAVQALGLHDGQVVRPTVEAREGQWPLSGWARLAMRPPTLAALQQLFQPSTLPLLAQSASRPEVARLLESLAQTRMRMADLSPARLMQWLQHSGWMSEAQLARGSAIVPDTKQLLRQLIQRWSDAPPGVQSLLSEALNDIEARQLQAADAPVGREWVFSFVLPFSDAEPVTVQLVKPGAGSAGDDLAAPLTVHLHVHSQALGEVWLQSRLLGAGQTDLTLWAVREDVVQAARLGLPRLAQALAEEGLQLLRSEVIHGERPSDRAPPPWRPPVAAGRWVDVQA
jgi:hypothetical protein